MFWEISSGRPANEAGPGRVPYSEIDAYIRLTGTEIDGDHLAILREMDIAFVNEMRLEAKRNL